MRYILQTALICAGILMLCLAGCGGGGGPSVSGTVYIPGGSGLAARGTADTAGPGVIVTLGSVNADGTILTPIATGTTDDQGHYSIPVADDFKPGPTFNVAVGPADTPTLTNLVLGLAVDISPATHAAREELYNIARARSKPIAQLDTSQVNSFMLTAVPVAAAAQTGTDVAAAVDSSTTALLASAAVKSALPTAIAPDPIAITPVCLKPLYGVQGQTVRVAISGYGLAPTPDLTDITIDHQGEVVPHVVSAADTKLVVDFNVGATAIHGYHYFNMTRLGSTPAIIALYVRTPTDAPVINNIDIYSGIPGQVVDVTLTGLAFDVQGIQVFFQASPIQVQRVRVISPTTIKARFVIPPNCTLGDYLFAVSTDSGVSGGATFSVVAVPENHGGWPHIVRIAPNSYTIPAGATQPATFTVHFYGSNFRSPHPFPDTSFGAGQTYYFTDARNFTSTGFDATMHVLPNCPAANNLIVSARNTDAAGQMTNAVNFTVIRGN
ncbi:MAG: hypothetical protein WCJ56_05850 [bacterium]